MAGANTLSTPASGTHTRVQMQRTGQALIPHGTLQSYDPETGAFTAFMDFQAAGDDAYSFSPATPGAGTSFTDQNGLIWNLVR